MSKRANKNQATIFKITTMTQPFSLSLSANKFGNKRGSKNSFNKKSYPIRQNDLDSLNPIFDKQFSHQ